MEENSRVRRNFIANSLMKYNIKIQMYCEKKFIVIIILIFCIYTILRYKKIEKRGGRKKNKVVRENTWFTLKSCSCAQKAYQDLKMKTK